LPFRLQDWMFLDASRCKSLIGPARSPSRAELKVVLSTTAKIASSERVFTLKTSKARPGRELGLNANSAEQHRLRQNALQSQGRSSMLAGMKPVKRNASGANSAIRAHFSRLACRVRRRHCCSRG